MRVNDTDPTSGTDVLTDRVEEKRALPHAGFTDDIRVVPAIGQGKEEGILPSIAVAYAEADVFVVFHAQANRHSERLFPPAQSAICHSRLCELGGKRFLRAAKVIAVCSENRSPRRSVLCSLYPSGVLRSTVHNRERSIDGYKPVSMIESMSTTLEKEIQTFEKNKEKLLGEAKGRFVLIKDEDVVDDFGSYGDALSEGYKRFGNVEFLVKEVKEDEGVNFFTRSLNL